MQSSRQALLRAIPRVDEIAAAPCFEGLSVSALTRATREVLEEIRGDILSEAADRIPSPEEIRGRVLDRYRRAALPGLRPAINGTGIVLHTNLGRAPLWEGAARAAYDTAVGYSTLEYRPGSGERVSRHSHVESLLRKLTGGEGAMVVNNNAAALLLALSALAAGREVVVSRGELVEIGDSFRLPDVLAQSGAVLREVGATNKTRAEDYTRAIGPDTAALLKVHTSNYRIVGFTGEVSLKELVALGERHGLPVLHDLGGGLLLPPGAVGLRDEPCVRESVAAGASLVAFSGDKLLGGPQAGILVGKAPLIQALKRHPLARALRIDKLCLAALEATLQAYLEPDAAKDRLPVLAMLCASEAELLEKAEGLRRAIGPLEGCAVEVAEDPGQVGGGAVPLQTLPSYGVALLPREMTVDRLSARLSALDTPIVGHIRRGRYLLNALTLRESEFVAIAEALRAIFAQNP